MSSFMRAGRTTREIVEESIIEEVEETPREINFEEEKISPKKFFEILVTMISFDEPSNNNQVYEMLKFLTQSRNRIICKYVDTEGVISGVEELIRGGLSPEIYYLHCSANLLSLTRLESLMSVDSRLTYSIGRCFVGDFYDEERVKANMQMLGDSSQVGDLVKRLQIDNSASFLNYIDNFVNTFYGNEELCGDLLMAFMRDNAKVKKGDRHQMLVNFLTPIWDNERPNIMGMFDFLVMRATPGQGWFTTKQRNKARKSLEGIRALPFAPNEKHLLAGVFTHLTEETDQYIGINFNIGKDYEENLFDISQAETLQEILDAIVHFDSVMLIMRLMPTSVKGVNNETLKRHDMLMNICYRAQSRVDTTGCSDPLTVYVLTNLLGTESLANSRMSAKWGIILKPQKLYGMWEVEWDSEPQMSFLSREFKKDWIISTFKERRECLELTQKVTDAAQEAFDEYCNPRNSIHIPLKIVRSKKDKRSEPVELKWNAEANESYGWSRHQNEDSSEEDPFEESSDGTESEEVEGADWGDF